MKKKQSMSLHFNRNQTESHEIHMTMTKIYYTTDYKHFITVCKETRLTKLFKYLQF